jgi:hypothetical protein
MIHMIAEARRTAGKSRLETVLLIQPKPAGFDPYGPDCGQQVETPTS